MKPEDPVIGLSESQIVRRVQAAALATGLGHGFTGNSGRIGKLHDLSDSGADIQDLMNAGWWESHTMPARYVKESVTSSPLHKGNIKNRPYPGYPDIPE